MSSYRRIFRPGGTYFFTATLAERGSHLLVERIDELRAAVAETRGARPFRIDAWVVMPDHIHAVWALPEGDADYSVRWGAIKVRFTMNLRRAGFSPPDELPVVTEGRNAGMKPGLRVTKRERGVWQRRFWEYTYCDATDLEMHVRYRWGNPAKHGYVERAVDWPYSSIHRDIRAGRVDPGWARDMPDRDFWE